MAVQPAPSRPPDPEVAPPYGLAYYRVSTTEQANTSYDEDGFSIQAQREYCQRKAADMGVQLVEEFVDRGKSARTADRPSLQAMLTRIKEDSDIQFVFVHKLDRLARNRHDDVQIGLLLAKHSVRLVSCTENIDDSPSGKLVHGIMADIAEWYSANLSEEAKKGMRKKVEYGGTPGRAPLGYVNERHKIIELGKDVGTVRIHETFAPIITQCFKLYAAGRCTLAEVAAYANDVGLVMPAAKNLPERPISPQHMQRVLRNRYYTGWIHYDGVDYQGEHPPLIDEATFDRVQALLTARDTNRDKSTKRPHHLTGIAYCAHCGRRFGITLTHGRRRDGEYLYFYCLGRQTDKASCPQGYVALGDVEDAVRNYLARLHLPTVRIQALRQAVLAEYTGQYEQGQAEIAKQKRRIIALEQRLKKAKAAYYADALDLDDFKTEQAALRYSITAAATIIASRAVELDSFTQSLDDALLLVEQPQALYVALPEALKLLLMQAVFEKLWILDSRVIGCELTGTYAELLTAEARLVWDMQSGSSSDQLTTNGEDAASGEDEVVTHHRQREPWAGFAMRSNQDNGWVGDRPHVERPYGLLPVDRLFPGLQRASVSKMPQLVGVTGFKLNRELATFIRDCASRTALRAATGSTPTYHSARRRIRELWYSPMSRQLGSHLTLKKRAS